MNYVVFGKRLQQLRNQRGLTRYELCTPLNVNVPDLEAVEAGEYLPGPKNIERLACFLGVTPATLVRSTEAEGSYIAERLTLAAPTEPTELNYEQRALLHVLMHMQDALLRLYRALWKQKVYNPSELFEELRVELTMRCESLRDALVPLGFSGIVDHVCCPDRILESAEEAEEAGRNTGELAKTVWRPMLHRAQQWIVRELAAIGGSLTDDEIDDDEIIAQMHDELDVVLKTIAELDRINSHASIMHLFGDDVEHFVHRLNPATF